MFDLKYVRYKLRVVTGGRGKNGYFAAGEYTHTLRLTSELVDLRVGYANPVLKAQGAFNTRLDVGFPHKTKQRGKNLSVLFGAGNGNRTRTVKPHAPQTCASASSATPAGTFNIIHHNSPFVNPFLKSFLKNFSRFFGSCFAPFFSSFSTKQLAFFTLLLYNIGSLEKTYQIQDNF